MKVKVLLLVVTVASLIAALFVATGAIVNRGGSPRSAPHHWKPSILAPGQHA
jgi:hypothetical protein